MQACNQVLNMHVCDADLSMEAGGATEIRVRFSEVTRSCRVLLMSRSCATLQLLTTDPSSSSASTRCSSCWICCSRHRPRSFSSASFCCSSDISSCTGTTLELKIVEVVSGFTQFKGFFFSVCDGHNIVLITGKNVFMKLNGILIN